MLAILMFISCRKRNVVYDIGKNLKDYATMPFPKVDYFSNAVNHLIQEETSYDRAEMKEMHENIYGLLNPEQRTRKSKTKQVK